MVIGFMRSSLGNEMGLGSKMRILGASGLLVYRETVEKKELLWEVAHLCSVSVSTIAGTAEDKYW